jgi:hypothetical protein
VKKANGRKRLLICDGHDSHITGNFIMYCLRNNIALLIMPPHSSHLLQPLDVGLFGPLKKALSARVDRLIRTGVHRLQKAEWVQYYADARQSAFSEQNINGGWRGAGLFPPSRSTVLRRLPSYSTPPPSQFSSKTIISFDNQLITSSPPDAISLRATKEALNQAVVPGKLLSTPIHRYIPRSTSTTEHLRAQISILQCEKRELQSVISNRKQRQKGKRVVLNGQMLVTLPELQRAVAEAEKQTKEKRKKQGLKRKTRANSIQSSASADEKDITEEQERIIEDCIVVERY